MFGITKEHIAPIIDYIRQNDANVDFNKIGDWGIVFMCCGALHGQIRTMTERLLKHLNEPVTTEADDEYWAVFFAELIKQWAQDEAGMSLARQRLQATGKFNEESIEKMLPYFTIAIMLNSLTDMDTTDLRELRKGAAASESGWPGFFFAAGMLLNNFPEVNWNRWGSALLSLSGERKTQLKELFETYSG